jgi:hypothetical protein
LFEAFFDSGICVGKTLCRIENYTKTGKKICSAMVRVPTWQHSGNTNQPAPEFAYIEFFKFVYHLVHFWLFRGDTNQGIGGLERNLRMDPS